MIDRKLFQQEVDNALARIDQQDLSYDEGEFWMVRWPFEYIQFYALNNQLLNTSIALHLARGLHNGQHRKFSLTKNGVAYRLPYVFHSLIVCRMLVDLTMPIPKDEEDIVLAAALCHDMLEDLEFTDQGKELIWKYNLDPRVYEVVKLVTKRPDFTPEEAKEHFKAIQENRMALLVKLSDRGHNVEDLYNMSAGKIHEYVGETREHILPMCKYGLTAYPELRTALRILKDKIECLTNAADVMVDRCEAREQELVEKLAALKEENKVLREKFFGLWQV